MKNLIELVKLYLKVIQLDNVDMRVVETIVQNIMILVPKNVDIEKEIKKNQLY